MILKWKKTIEPGEAGQKITYAVYNTVTNDEKSVNMYGLTEEDLNGLILLLEGVKKL